MLKSNITCPFLPTGAHHDTHDEEQYYLSTSSYRSPSWYTWWRAILPVNFFLQEPIMIHMMKRNITCPLLPTGAHHDTHDEEQYYLSTSSYRSPSWYTWWRAILPVNFFLQEPIMIHMMKRNITCPLLPTGAHHDTHDEEQYYLSTSSYRSPSWYTWWRAILPVHFFLQEPIMIHMMKSNITCPLLPTGAHHDEEQYHLSTSSYRSPSWYTWWRAILAVHFFLQEPIMIHMMKSNISCPLLPIGAHHDTHDEEQYNLSNSSYRSPSWSRAILPVHFFLQEPIMIHMMKRNITCPLLPTGAHHDTHDEEQYYLSTSSYRSPSWWRAILPVHFFLQEPIMMKSNITCPLLPTGVHHVEEQY